jgi:hypothetical protein
MKRLIWKVKNFIIRVERLSKLANHFIILFNRFVLEIDRGTSGVPPLAKYTKKGTKKAEQMLFRLQDILYRIKT